MAAAAAATGGAGSSNLKQFLAENNFLASVLDVLSGPKYQVQTVSDLSVLDDDDWESLKTAIGKAPARRLRLLTPPPPAAGGDRPKQTTAASGNGGGGGGAGGGDGGGSSKNRGPGLTIRAAGPGARYVDARNVSESVQRELINAQTSGVEPTRAESREVKQILRTAGKFAEIMPVEIGIIGTRVFGVKVSHSSHQQHRFAHRH